MSESEEKTMDLIAEKRAEKEALEGVPNPIPALVEALQKGVRVMENYKGIDNLPKWASEIAEKINTAKIVSDKPKVEIVKELIEKGEIPTGVTLQDLHGPLLPGKYEVRFYVQDIIPTLKALGVIPEDAPTRLPDGNENGYLLQLFKQEGKISKVEKPEDISPRGIGVTEFSKQSEIPGVSVALGIPSDSLKTATHISRLASGHPYAQYIRLDFTPSALASFTETN